MTILAKIMKWRRKGWKPMPDITVFSEPLPFPPYFVYYGTDGVITAYTHPGAYQISPDDLKRWWKKVA